MAMQLGRFLRVAGVASVAAAASVALLSATADAQNTKPLGLPL